MVLSAADRFGDAEAVVDGPLRLTFAEVVQRIRCAAGAFADLGVDKGERVAIWAPNSAEWIIAAFGLLTAGGVLVPVNTRFKTEEAGDIIARSGVKAVLVQKGFLGQDFTAPVGTPVIDLKSDFLSSGSPFERAVSGDDIADIIFTSGTTGRPKGAMMNHRQTLRMYEEWATLADLRAGDRYLQINPYFHTFGLKVGLVTSFLRGASMLPVAVFDVDTVVELIAREAITMLPGPPTLYHSLLTVGDKSKLSTLRAGVTGAADIPVELVRRIHDELPFQTLMTGYGLTEAGNVTFSLPGDSFEDVATTAGVPARGLRCASPATARCWCAATASCRATSTIPRPPRRRSTATAGYTPEIWAASPRRVGCVLSGARRTCSSSAASTPIRPRSRAFCSATRPSRRRR